MGYTGTEVVLFIIAQVVVAAGVWGGIRADIRGMHARISQLQDSADSAHARIDAMLGHGDTGNHRTSRR